MISVYLDGVLHTDAAVKSCREGNDLCYSVCRTQIPASAELMQVKLDFLDAAAGDEGYYVLPDWIACFLTKFTPREDQEFSFRGNLLPIIGAKFSDRALLVVVEGMAHNYTLQVAVKDGKYSLMLRYNLKACDLYEDVRIRVITLPSPDATYVDIAHAYRKIAVEKKKLVPLAQRVSSEPILSYAVDNMPIIRIRMGWKPVPTPEEKQTLENEPPMHVACTFSQVGELIDEMKRQGIEKAEICLVGWNIRGHDGRWPQIFPVEEALGGEEELKKLIAHAKSQGYHITCHTNNTDAYHIADTWDENDLIRTKSGNIAVHSAAWSGGRTHNLCPQVALNKYIPRDLPRIKALGFEGFHYIDVISIIPPRVCFHPDHPLTAEQSADCLRGMLQQMREAIGGVGSEGAYDYTVESLDFALYTGLNLLYNCPAAADAVVPLWQLIYHGYVLSNPSAETVNFMVKKPASRLRFYEYGGIPVLYYFSKFVGTEDGNWMGNDDILCATEEQRVTSVTQMKAMLDEYKAFSPRQLAFMEDHKELAPGVFETVYSDGYHTVVNYSDEDYTLGNRIVPAQDLIQFFQEA